MTTCENRDPTYPFWLGNSSLFALAGLAMLLDLIALSRALAQRG